MSEDLHLPKGAFHAVPPGDHAETRAACRRVPCPSIASVFAPTMFGFAAWKRAQGTTSLAVRPDRRARRGGGRKWRNGTTTRSSSEQGARDLIGGWRQPDRPGAARAPDRPRRETGQEDPHFGRRAVQLHQYRDRAGELSLGKSAFSRNRRSAVTPSGTFSASSSVTASPGTKRRSGSCSATVPPGRSSPCCWRNATGAASRSGFPRPSARSAMPTGGSAWRAPRRPGW